MRQRWFIGLVVSMLVLAGLTANRADGIYGGTDANFSEFPWMVSIQTQEKGSWIGSCGGTLVSESWVLTAAHCVTDDGDDMRVIVGKDMTGGAWNDGDRRRVHDPVVYPAADGTPLWLKTPRNRGDIALLKLQAPVYDVPKVQLAYGEMPAESALTAVGWGCTDDYWWPDGCPAAARADRLRKLDHVRVKPDSQCWDEPAQKPLADAAICTKADRQGLTLGGPRKGDSGGPLLLRVGGRWIQLGIFSHLPQACNPTYGICGFFDYDVDSRHADGDPNYTGSTSIKQYRDWITATISESGSNARISTALIVDSSGSMTSNDPQNRRRAGANAYVTASLPDDEVGVVDFDDSARVLSPAVAVGPNRKALTDAIARIDSSGGTDLGAGLTSGCSLLQSAGGGRRAAIFLTDGQGSYADQSSCYRSRGWPIFTIGLGSGVDRTLLSRIATETGGRYLQLDSSTNLVCEFQQIRSQIAGTGRRDCTPTGSISQGQTLRFPVVVGDLLEQFTFTNTWPGSDIEMTVTSPSGRAYDRGTTAAGFVASVGASFETFTISKPEAGEWQVELYGADIPAGGEPYTFSTVGLPSEGDQLDSDVDGLSDPRDNCAYVANPEQADRDDDGLGDLCDADPGLVQATGTAGGTVPATLALSIGAPARFDVFVPGVARSYTATTTATVTSTAGDATLRISDPDPVAPGRLVNGTFALRAPLQAGVAGGLPGALGTLRTYAAPVSNDVVELEFHQAVAATDPLRTGTYAKTLVLTLTTETP